MPKKETQGPRVWRRPGQRKVLFTVPATGTLFVMHGRCLGPRGAAGGSCNAVRCSYRPPETRLGTRVSEVGTQAQAAMMLDVGEREHGSEVVEFPLGGPSVASRSACVALVLPPEEEHIMSSSRDPLRHGPARECGHGVQEAYRFDARQLVLSQHQQQLLMPEPLETWLAVGRASLYFV